MRCGRGTGFLTVKFLDVPPFAESKMTKPYQFDNYLSDSEVLASRYCRTRVGGVRLDDDR